MANFTPDLEPPIQDSVGVWIVRAIFFVLFLPFRLVEVIFGSRPPTPQEVG